MDVVIIGAGPVGLFAAFQAGMLGMKSCVIDSLDFVGGQCSALYPEKPIYDIPGHPEISAQSLISNLEKQAASFKPEYYLGQQVTGVKKTGESFEVTTSAGVTISSKIVIIAAGCGAFGPNKPPLEDIESYEGKSIFYSVLRVEDFRDKKIVIAGGGDSAVDWSIALSSVAKMVYLVHRRDKFRATPESLRRLAEISSEGRLEIVVPYQLHALEGGDGYLTSVVVQNLDGSNKKLEADILLPFFGLKMSLGPILDWGLNIEANHIKVSKENYETNIPGIYAIGDIASYSGKIKLILTGFAEAASALHHAYSRVFEGKSLHFQYSTTKGLPN